MIKLFDLNDFVELLSPEVVETLENDNFDIERFYESFREPGKEVVELDYHDLNTLFKIVHKTSKQEGYESGQEVGWNDGTEQAQYHFSQDY